MPPPQTIELSSSAARDELASRRELPRLGEQFFPDPKNLESYFESPSYFGLLSDVISTPAFQRLRDIRFLGAIDYLVHPNGSQKNRRHSRFDHSLGVARLAMQFCQACKVCQEDSMHIVVAALLHDVGHGPLSHSLEPVFREKYRLSHHTATELIVNGHVPVGHELRGVLRTHKLDTKKITSLISGSDEAPYAEIFRNPINIDTIEGITRAYTYIALGGTQAACHRVLFAMLRRDPEDERILDSFWQLKNTVYNQLINSRSGVLADHLCQEYMRKNAGKFWSGEYFWTESAFRKSHPRLFSLLGELRDSQVSALEGLSGPIEYDTREFFIDYSFSIDDFGSLYKRYKQKRTPTLLKNAAPARTIDQQVVSDSKNKKLI